MDRINLWAGLVWVPLAAMSIGILVAALMAVVMTFC